MTTNAAAIADARVVTGGDARDAAFLFSPSEHWPELHRTVALGAGQGGDAVAVALHQSLHDLLLKGVAGIDDVMGDAQLIADTGSVHKPFGAAGPFAAHQPERQPFHLPAALHQQGCRQ